jgi:hypothetical protein
LSYIGKIPATAPLTSSDVADGIITNAKLAQDIISADTALGATPADTDEFLVSDAGVLKRMDYSYIKGGGKTLQVVQTVKTDTTSTTSTSFADISGMTVAITPAATSSKILVYVNVHAGWSTNYSASFSLLRGTTQIYMGDASSSRTRAFYGGQTKENRQSFTAGAVYLDSPSSSSEVIYKLQWLAESGSTLYLNRDAGNADAAYSTMSASSITVMEIGA